MFNHKWNVEIFQEQALKRYFAAILIKYSSPMFYVKTNIFYKFQNYKFCKFEKSMESNPVEARNIRIPLYAILFRI